MHPPPRAASGFRSVTRRFTCAVLACAIPLTLAAGGSPPIAIVVGKGVSPASPLSPTIVEGIFARKRQLWDDGSRIIAVNLPADHPLRREFSVWVFKRTPEGMQDYWSEQYFHGVLPPPVLGSEEAVLRFVTSTPGAIGYVSSCNIDKRVEVVALILNPDGTAPCRR
jgi:hypothetical protein